MDSFSRRNKINIEPVEITIRFDAPAELREWLFCLVKRLKYSIKSFRNIVCQMSYQNANPNQWGENSYMEEEIRELLANCKWYYIYDIIEETYKQLPTTARGNFTTSLNNFFCSNGYGWKLEDGRILSRGDDAFEETIRLTTTCIEQTNPDAFSEIKEALFDISKRPEPDVTGAIQHSMAALECFCRTVFNDRNSTLGDIIKHHRDKIAKPLDSAMEKLWAFASNYGRHLQEGNVPVFDDAEFVVRVCASLIVYFYRLHNTAS